MHHLVYDVARWTSLCLYLLLCSCSLASGSLWIAHGGPQLHTNYEQVRISQARPVLRFLTIRKRDEFFRLLLPPAAANKGVQQPSNPHPLLVPQNNIVQFLRGSFSSDVGWGEMFLTDCAKHGAWVRILRGRLLRGKLYPLLQVVKRSGNWEMGVIDLSNYY